MGTINFEFKAKINNLEFLENRLKLLNPKYIGEDVQVDTYFNINKGRLKLREGNIENALIYYERDNKASAKQSNILLYKHNPDNYLKEILIKANGIKIIVNKIRKIYYLDNVKFHFDTIEELGTFVEVEAIDTNGSIGVDKLKIQCEFYADYFNINNNQYISKSYSDMIAEIE